MTHDPVPFGAFGIWLPAVPSKFLQGRRDATCGAASRTWWASVTLATIKMFRWLGRGHSIETHFLGGRRNEKQDKSMAIYVGFPLEYLIIYANAFFLHGFGECHAPNVSLYLDDPRSLLVYTSMYIHLYLGGGFKYFLCSSSLGDIIWLIFFSDGLVQPPTRKGSMVENWCFFLNIPTCWVV